MVLDKANQEENAKYDKKKKQQRLHAEGDKFQKPLSSA